MGYASRTDKGRFWTCNLYKQRCMCHFCKEDRGILAEAKIEAMTVANFVSMIDDGEADYAKAKDEADLENLAIMADLSAIALIEGGIDEWHEGHEARMKDGTPEAFTEYDFIFTLDGSIAEAMEDEREAFYADLMGSNYTPTSWSEIAGYEPADELV